MNTMEYKQYVGSAEVDVDGDALVGKLLFIRDTITYSASTPAGLRRAFEEAVDDYLSTCAELGDAPEQPCKGTFQVRVGQEKHLAAALEARRCGMTLNAFICHALDSALTVRAPHPSKRPIAVPTPSIEHQVLDYGSDRWVMFIKADAAHQRSRTGSPNAGTFTAGTQQQSDALRAAIYGGGVLVGNDDWRSGDFGFDVTGGKAQASSTTIPTSRALPVVKASH